jgi:acetyl-CoA synthetase (ADP-forming)
MNLIEHALDIGQSSLSEHDAKQFLSGFGINVCRETLVDAAAAEPAESAVAAAVSIGFPVVLKVSGTHLLHKTEVEGVALNLRSELGVRDEARRLLRIPGCEGLLVQEMVKGDRELVCGLVRDRQLGPCVMFGLGGVLTEVLDDAVFRVASITAAEAAEMLAEIRSAKILGAFRGQAPVDRIALAGILVALGNIGLQHEAIQAIDINPVKIRHNGMPVVVDALITLQKKGPSWSDEGGILNFEF